MEGYHGAHGAWEYWGVCGGISTEDRTEGPCHSCGEEHVYLFVYLMRCVINIGL